MRMYCGYVLDSCEYDELEREKKRGVGKALYGVLYHCHVE